MLNEDYKDMLRSLADEGAEFLLIGAYAMALHGYVRSTGDLDLWVQPSAQNSAAVLKALERFGAPLHDLTLEDLQKGDTVFQIGVAPLRIDIVTGVTGLEFPDASARSVGASIDGIPVRVLSITDLVRNKRATGRAKDLLDAQALEALEPGDR